MATFQEQVQGLTSISVGTTPNTDELSQFLKDGVLDVTSRWLAIRPQDVELFARVSSEQTSNAALNLNGAKIVSVIREDGISSNNWRNCRKISPGSQYDVTDEESLKFASKINPAYMVGNNGQISVFPSPGSDPNSFKVYYVNNVPVDKSAATLVYTHTDIGYFPDNKVYLVVLYASIQTIQAVLASGIVSVSPSLTTVSYIPVSAGDVTAGTVTTATVSAPGVFTGDTVGGAPTYTPYNPALNFTPVETYIDTEEDPELAAAKLQQLSMQMQESSIKMQNEVNKFTRENTTYQAGLQESLQELQIENQTNIAQAQHDLQVAIGNEDRDLQTKIQNSVNAMNAIINDNQNKINQYQVDVQISTTQWQQYQSLYGQFLNQYNSAFQLGQQQGGQGGR